MQCGLFPRAFVLKWTVDFLEAKTHPKRLLIAEYKHNTKQIQTQQKKKADEKIFRTENIGKLEK